MMQSGIYEGTLRHRRWQTTRHEFTYPLFLAWMDIDRLPELMQVSPLTSYNRGNILSYQERDHFGDASLSLRARIAADAERQGVPAPTGPIFLLTHLRTFGYNFNPVSFFYCYDERGKLDRVLAEVNNTFAETHNYWLTPELESAAGNAKRYQFDKKFHVSPFLGMAQRYDWTFTPPGDELVVECMNFEGDALTFDSTMKLERRPWSTREMHRAVLRFPFLTARVIAAIHWQALRLMLKRVPVVHHPGGNKFTPRNSRDLGASWKGN
jgi:uncharacterized protein